MKFFWEACKGILCGCFVKEIAVKAECEGNCCEGRMRRELL